MMLRFQRTPKGETAKFQDPPALQGTPGMLALHTMKTIVEVCFFLAADALRSIVNLVKILPEILPAFLPYALVLVAFGVFVIWNGGIVLGMYISRPRIETF